MKATYKNKSAALYMMATYKNKSATILYESYI